MSRLALRMALVMVVVVLAAVGATYAAAVARSQAAVLAAFDEAARVTDDARAAIGRALDSGADDAALSALVTELSMQEDVRLALEGFGRGLIVDTGPAFGVAIGEQLPPDPVLVTPAGPATLGGSGLSDEPPQTPPDSADTQGAPGSPDSEWEETGPDSVELLEPEDMEAPGLLTAEPLLLYVGIGEIPKEPGLAFDGWLAALVAVIVLAATGAAVWTARRVLAPVGDLTEAAAGLASGDLSARVPVTGRDELATLSASFNRMADELEAGADRRRAMTDDINHELRSPLTNVRALIGAARDGLMPTDDALAALDEETGHLAAIVGDLDTLIRSRGDRIGLTCEAVDLDELTAVVATAHRGRAAEAGIDITVDGTAGVAAVDVGRIRQVLGNILDNALRHTPEGGAVRITLDGNETSATIEVADTGGGIPPEHLPHLFERFYRANRARDRAQGGTGLGLAVAHELVTAHGGSLTVSSTPDLGSTFTMQLPRTPVV